MKIGVLATGNTAVRGAHCLAADRLVEEVVVIGPAKSRNFRVVANANGCDYLLGSGPSAPERARKLGVPLVWDGAEPEDGVVIWGASPRGLVLAMASRETDPRVVALAHPQESDGTTREVRFPDPVGPLMVDDALFAGRPLAVGRSQNEFAACLITGSLRNVTVVEQSDFMSGICLAAGAMVAGDQPIPVWEKALDYLKAATAMGLLMGEA